MSILDWGKSLQEDPEGYHTFTKAYSDRRPTYRKAIEVGKRAIAEIKLQHQKDVSLRIAHIDGRMKSAYSIIRKGLAKGVKAEEVLDRLDDVVGFRVVVNNLRDVDPLIEAMEAHPAFTVLRKEDHTDPEGYRAVHLKALCSWPEGAEKTEVVCEVQVRTVLQDAWAIMAHHDFYKNTAALPELAQPISAHMSRSLANADRLADDLRLKIESLVEPPNDLSDGAPLDRDGIAFLYYAVFGEKPQEYEVAHLLSQADRFGISTVGQARAGLTEEVIKKLAEIHSDRFWIKMNPAEVFEYCLLYALKAKDAFADYRNRVERDWAEVEAIARSEALGEMPDTYHDFVQSLKADHVPWDALTELGAVKKCIRCGTDYLDGDAAVEAVSEFYECEDGTEELWPLLTEIDGFGSQDHPGVCSYCGWQMSRDD